MATTVAETRLDDVAVPAVRPARGPRWLVVALLLLVGAVVVLGAARWNGQVPFGSDNDEYRLVAQQLVHLDAPVVAGVEGTKYPLGYPAVLAAIDAVGLPVVDAALLLNVGLVCLVAAFAGAAARHRGAAAAVAAAASSAACPPAVGRHAVDDARRRLHRGGRRCHRRRCTPPRSRRWSFRRCARSVG